MTRKRKQTWIVVADGATAKFFVRDEVRSALIPGPVPNLTGTEARKRTHDIKSDRPGRSFSPGASGRRSAIEPHHDYHKLEKRAFTKRLAELLDDAFVARRFDQLILAAPRRSLGELRTLLGDGVRKCVVQEIPKDLTHHTAAALWQIISKQIVDRK